MRPPNNQSLTRLAATLPPAPTAPTSPLAQQRCQHWLRPPSRRAAKLWHVGFASILLNYPPGQKSFSRSWIDKLPGPVFRRHARRRDLEVGNGEGRPLPKCVEENQINVSFAFWQRGFTRCAVLLPGCPSTARTQRKARIARWAKRGVQWQVAVFEMTFRYWRQSIIFVNDICI